MYLYKTKTCCFTGHRKLPRGKIESIIKNLDREVENLINQGVTDFIFGGALRFTTSHEWNKSNC